MQRIQGVLAGDIYFHERMDMFRATDLDKSILRHCPKDINLIFIFSFVMVFMLGDSFQFIIIFFLQNNENKKLYIYI